MWSGQLQFESALIHKFGGGAESTFSEIGYTGVYPRKLTETCNIVPLQRTHLCCAWCPADSRTACCSNLYSLATPQWPQTRPCVPHAQSLAGWAHCSTYKVEERWL